MARISGGYGDYGHVADVYDKGRLYFPSWIFGRLWRRKVGKPTREIDILDVGCGTGVSTRQLKIWGWIKVKGNDIDPLMIARARQLPHRDSADLDTSIEYIVSPVEKLRLPNESFDMITTFGGLPWFADVTGAMENIRRMLRPGGVFMAADEQFLSPRAEYRLVKKKWFDQLPFHRSVFPSNDDHVIHPTTLFKKTGFKYIRHYEKVDHVRPHIEEALNYLMCGSFIGRLPDAHRQYLRRDLETVCRYQELMHNGPRWEIKYSATLGRK